MQVVQGGLAHRATSGRRGRGVLRALVRVMDGARWNRDRRRHIKACQAYEEVGEPRWSVASPGTTHLPEVLGDAFAISRSEARRRIVQGAVYLDDVREGRLDVPTDELDGTTVRLGRRREVAVRLDGPRLALTHVYRRFP